MWRTFFLLQILFISLSAFASAHPAAAAPGVIRLFAWKPYDASPAFVIPVRESELPAHAARTYLQSLRSHPDLAKLFPNQTVPDLQVKNFREINPGQFSSQTVLLANRAGDFQESAARIAKYSQTFEAGGMTSYVLPISADLGLTKAEAEAFRDRVANSFSLMVAMGGDDVDPRLYHEPNLKARNIVPVRDESEIEMIRSYVAKREGFMFGTCRGHQLTSVALGYKLIQDVPSDVPAKEGEAVEHAIGFHSTHVFPTPHRFLIAATQGQREVEINTYHHQAVIYHPNGPLVLAARSPDGIVESLEFRNGHGLLVQFHPETMNNDLGERVLRQVTIGKTLAVRRSCEASFASKP